MKRVEGELVRRLREMCHFTREGLAMHARVAGGAREVASIERDSMELEDELVEALARALGVEVEALTREAARGDDDGAA